MSKSDGEFNRCDGVTLRDYFNQKVNDLEEKINIRFELQKTALEKQESTLNERLAGMNEFRNAMSDAASKFVTGKEVDLKFEASDKSRRDNISLFISLVAFAMSMLIGILEIVGGK